MNENNICIPLAQLFQKDSKQLFKYDFEKNLIYVDKKSKEDTQSHEVLFSELQNITNQLNEVQCNYSVDEQGDIILNCSDADSHCKIKCITK